MKVGDKIMVQATVVDVSGYANLLDVHGNRVVLSKEDAKCYTGFGVDDKNASTEKKV